MIITLRHVEKILYAYCQDFENVYVYISIPFGILLMQSIFRDVNGYS